MSATRVHIRVQYREIRPGFALTNQKALKQPARSLFACIDRFFHSQFFTPFGQLPRPFNDQFVPIIHIVYHMAVMQLCGTNVSPLTLHATPSSFGSCYSCIRVRYLTDPVLIHFVIIHDVIAFHL